jgi:hypothetical protein
MVQAMEEKGRWSSQGERPQLRTADAKELSHRVIQSHPEQGRNCVKLAELEEPVYSRAWPG